MFDAGGTGGSPGKRKESGWACGYSHALRLLFCERRDVCANRREKCRDRRGVFSFTAGPHSSTHAEGQAIFLYFQKVIDAGGFKKYEQAHLARLTKTFAPKLRLPARPARLVAEYWGHVGFY